ncbi:MAG: hypothetical protein KJ970_13920 [Candidatus Eisenbacteria bacterium]|uniref:Uncharacterized protein n=1 Tax=Eiseniibacteriota bacterium TaxID=2212470 RepID=A0A948RYM6_UNCEI|nr:hypothetical protein [Candidatus Eisenbacteria bacterium]MBU1947486.1 hypothetical protein [Candidatus Eisenbacteria bacterium]MBU2692012.1 hypothetical protein [Candidatus Eisenbacteria bacterium]
MRKSTISANRQWLVETMQLLNYGSIHGLLVVDGEPFSDPPPRIVRELKIPGDNDPRPECQLTDFELQTEVIQFFSELDRLGTGTIERIEVRHGKPFRVFIESPIRESQPK